jgi:putative ABC transport system substrate-binding protein
MLSYFRLVCPQNAWSNSRSRIGYPQQRSSAPLPKSAAYMSYGSDGPALFRRTASSVHKIMGGEKPAHIPVEQATKFNLVINLNTARALGLTIPPTLLARADQVIE